jgi:hypothetical protein
MTVEAIKEAISHLPDDARHSLAVWINELDYDDWDHQMEADFSTGGRGMALVEAMQHEAGLGKAISFEKGLEQARKHRSSK